ncbi:MAG: zinc-binding dehydrogenase [Novosphingobium sp.]
MTVTAKQITSSLAADGTLTVALKDQQLPDPQGFEILVRIEAAPINPSDLALLFGAADLANAEFSPGKVVANLPAAAMIAFSGRVGEAMPVGNEGAGTVIAAGSEVYAQSLMGKRVSCSSGGMYASHVITDARRCMPLPDGVTAEQGAAAFVNPFTALGFVQTMRKHGFTGLIHTAAASNLGQMLVKLCAEEGIPLVNVVRSAEQVAILKAIGAEYVINSSDEDFFAQLVEAIAATGAMMAFDAIGGGKMAATLLTAMEAVASNGAPYSRYGSDVPKQVYIYGMLDTGPTILKRTFGFTWGVNGWLLMPFLASVGAAGVAAMSQRVMSGLTNTFASHYKAQVSLEQMLTRDAALAYNAKATGEKYLVVP